MSDAAVRTARATILQNLEPLFRKAEERGLWFYSNYQGLWFSPKQLRKAHGEGRFIWGPANWQLRDPQEMVSEAERAAGYANESANRIRAMVQAD